MQQINTIFVTGSTGNQGGAAARHLVNNGFRVKALTRDPDSANAQKLKNHGIEIVKGDLNRPETYRDHLKDVDGIFSVQTFINGVDYEIKQGIQLANLAKEYPVRHFVYTSAVGADLKTGVPHWESKYKIENHIKAIGIPHTIIRPCSFYENFLIPQIKSRLLKGKFVVPLDKKVIQQFVSGEDVGKLSAIIFKNPNLHLSRTITLAAEEMDQEQVAQLFSRKFGKEIKFQKLPSLITRLAMGKDLAKMFSWVNNNGGVFVKDLEALKSEFPGMLSLSEWIDLNFPKK